MAGFCCTVCALQLSTSSTTLHDSAAAAAAAGTPPPPLSNPLFLFLSLISFVHRSLTGGRTTEPVVGDGLLTFSRSPRGKDRRKGSSGLAYSGWDGVRWDRIRQRGGTGAVSRRASLSVPFWRRRRRRRRRDCVDQLLNGGGLSIPILWVKFQPPRGHRLQQPAGRGGARGNSHFILCSRGGWRHHLRLPSSEPIHPLLSAADRSSFSSTCTPHS
ncbi:hypothetical protein B296_00018246 [Ensete ventricosum]|uniref:Uncharacterized protein n=1 Tax=Ensete ventricosum TaxID=4639 RepID=A0A426ZH47_ENSVE|nr:hypothetical protein B296_00018246 [Ensete ventricosum]